MIMKRLFTFLFVLLTCITVNAQNDTKARVWKNSPNSTESNSSKLVGRNVTRAPMPSVTRGGNQMWWGYFNETMGYGGIGTGGYETFDAAIYIPAGHSFVGKSTIKAIRIFFEDASAVSDVKVWISKGSLPETVSNADYIQDVVNASSGANDIELTNPFVVNNEAIYVGYTFTAGGYPIMQGGEYVENSLYLRSSQNTWSAIDYLGCLALQILIESDGFPQNMASPSNFKTAIVELGKSAFVIQTMKPITTKNATTRPITATLCALKLLTRILNAWGPRDTIPANKRMEIPFPIPLTSTCSPSHISNIVPVTKLTVVTK